MGILLAIRRPFAPGELIRVGAFEGTVLRLDLRATVGETYDGHIVTIPNKEVVGSQITNFTRSEKRRVEVTISVVKEDDLEQLIQAAEEAMARVKERNETAPEAYFTSYSSSSVELSCRIWIDLPEQNFLKSRSELIIALRKRFDEGDLRMAYPKQRLEIETQPRKSA